MSDIIRLLPDSVANQIAAGEVVQYPAAALKELVENAVDAGATRIRIVVKDAGKTMLQVIDNGSGMSETDTRMAFERHATSKIRKADDLFALHTMGFRGEALPSICAISEVDVKSRQADSQMGTHLVITGSKIDLQEPCVCEKGTVITVRKLFFNTPARRKFLRSDSVELSRIMREFERLALVNNRIAMSIDTGTRNIDLPPGSFKQRIADLWKNNLNMQLLPVEVDTSLVKIEGFVSRPEFARRRNALQFLIVNGRNMRHPAFHKAIMGCYANLIAADTQPCYFLKFTVDPETIDVNISPTKTEIKFEYEQQIFPILSAAVKASLGQFSAVPSIDFQADALPLDPVDPNIGEKPDIELPENYNPFNRSDYNPMASTSNWEKLYAEFQENRKDSSKSNFDNPVSSYAPAQTTPVKSPNAVPGKSDVNPLDTLSSHGHLNLKHIETAEETQPVTLCMQVADKYIVTTSREGLLIIDQHRAHVKILYEEYMRRAADMELVAQRVLFPETVALDSTQQAALAGIEGDLRHLGFELEYESENLWKIMAVPAMMRNSDSRDVILRILDSVTEDSNNYGASGVDRKSLISGVALIMARSSAIKRGVHLKASEMEHIVGELFRLPSPALTPNGNRVYYVLSDDRLDSMFR